MRKLIDDPSTDGTSRARALPLVLLVVPVVYLAMASLIPRPFVFPDEAGAITNARFIAGMGGASPWWYLPGYGALVSPVLRATSDLGMVTWSFQILNAALGLLSAVGLWKCGRLRFPSLSERTVGMSAVVVLLYPSFQYFAALALADNLLITAGIWSILLVRWLQERGPTPGALASAAAFGLVASAHSRAAVVVLAAAIVLAVAQTTRRVAVSMFGVGVVATFLARSLLQSDVETFHSLGGRQSFADLVTANASIRSLAVLPFTLLGQIINLTTATAGLVVVGMVVLGRSTWDRGSAGSLGLDDDGDFHVLVLVGLAAALSALFTNQGQGDLAVYGRYLEVVLPVPLLVGLLSLFDKPTPRWLSSSGPAALVMAACVLVAVRGYEAFETRLQILNVSGVGLPIRATNRIDPIQIAIFGAVVMFVLGWVSVRNQRFILPALVVLFFASVIVPFERSIGYIDRVSEEGELAELIQEARVAGAAGCVGLDQAALQDPWAHENYQMLLLEVPFDYFYSNRESSPCGDLVVSSRPDLSSVMPGWRAVGWEHNRNHWLWASPEVVTQLGSQQAILPDPGSPLASLAADVSVEILADQPPDRTVEALVTVTNRSSSTFVPSSSLPPNSMAVRLGVEWRALDDTGERMHEPTRFDLEEPLRPGDSQVVLVSLSRDLPGLSVADGSWELRAELVQEFVQWAEDSAAGTAVIELDTP